MLFMPTKPPQAQVSDDILDATSAREGTTSTSRSSSSRLITPSNDGSYGDGLDPTPMTSTTDEQNENDDIDDHPHEESGDGQLTLTTIQRRERRRRRERRGRRQDDHPLEFCTRRLGVRGCPTLKLRSRRASPPRDNVDGSHLLHGTSYGGRNILSLLLHRSCQPTRISSPISSHDFERFVDRGRHWNTCPTVVLSMEQEEELDENGEIRAMSFDRDGILLATGDDRGIVRIYDFDDVRFMDVKRRNKISQSSTLWPKLEFQGRGKRRVERRTSGDAVDACGEAEASGAVEDASIVHTLERHSDENIDDSREDVQQQRIEPSVVRPVMSFQAGTKISNVLWSPNNQDHLVVSFANRSELHIYDMASDMSPLPCIRLGDLRHSMHLVPEGVTKALLLPKKIRSTCPTLAITQILTGGNRGTVRLWTIPTTSQKQQQQQRRRHVGTTSSICDFGVPKCAWSFSPFGDPGNVTCEGICDMLTLGPNYDDNDDELLDPLPTTTSSPSVTRSLVLLAGTNSSLVLLDLNRCTRKAFSTSVTPTVVTSWNLCQHMSRELSILDKGTKLPEMRWMAAHGLSLLRSDYTDSKYLLFDIGIVTMCGWVFIAKLTISSHAITGHGMDTSLRLTIVHRTPRIRCFNSSNDPIVNLGGMSLRFSLPEMPIPSAVLRRNVVWLGDVKQQKYTLPVKDKYVLSSDHGISTYPRKSASSTGGFRRYPGDGLLLVRFDGRCSSSSSSDDERGDDKGETRDACIHARLPLSGGYPSMLAAHPGGDWMVIGYGMTGVVTKQIELACLRKMPAWR